MYARQIYITILSLLLAATATAKKDSQVQKTYLFGMAASFTDTIVHFTPIEAVDSAWIDKRQFLMGRESYSYQLRDYLDTQLLMPHRTCVVIFDTNRKKLEKKYNRMLQLYTVPPKKGKGRRYDVRHIAQQDFSFKPVDMSQQLEQQQQEEDGQSQLKTKKKDRKEKTDRRRERPAGGDAERRGPRGK